ncbi:hypothetical protein PFICI_11936 [Pestalotiopsis fici W106-1]|uniref:CorA-like transporter domain-containing protein n=1 Tax=Pestalotiopsis fici (strain W106-1 / CGMCC3.15140) TaxID=1229662 RepID=W3WRU0_PESFW|nr:uncharacterized protein PFICI_11936 [Pestalotiopsis fici W106-1]ETS76549.1 hypothetical protein PFICI_11936 [Pestalotiopsis fici W106-1]
MTEKAWPRYFANVNASNGFASALQDQLTEYEDDIFVTQNSCMKITDVTKEGIKSHLIHNEIDFLSTYKALPRSTTRIISVESDNTISPLNINSSLAETLFNVYSIRPDFLRILLSFGDEPHIAEARSSNHAQTTSSNGDYTIMYKLNYVELNGRGPKNGWSTRHMGIYHHHSQDSDLLILLHCSPGSSMRQRMAKLLDSSQVTLSNKWLLDRPQDLHLLAISCYADNWRMYLRHIGDRFSHLNDIAMTSTAETAGKDYQDHIQELRHLLDLSMFATACCQSTMTVTANVPTLHSHFKKELQSFASVQGVLDDFVTSSASLQGRVRNAIEMVVNTLAMRNHLEATKLDQEMRDLTWEMKRSGQETAIITKKLQELTENTVDDSAIVRLITIVSAFYLPGSFVATLFGMNFFNFDDKSIAISRDFWVFVVAWTVLTLLTGGLFYASYQRKKRKQKHTDDAKV